jgi:hypothetical protein
VLNDIFVNKYNEMKNEDGISMIILNRFIDDMR